ncbi:MAG TPA: DUF5682 family protein [Ohtaekwangia sp.]|uniref:DUF5682 family protein n=1 Tax=Ohtaekwangia sp. TaxID=2066019 RepID=UPI002F95BDDD
MSIHVLGIRHHGPGSARNVNAFLEQHHPDIILVEGPPEGDELLRWSAHSQLKPPIAILAYRPDEPQQAVFYPFAEFSPEWQAIKFGASRNIPVRFMDLPLVHKFALERKEEKQEPGESQLSSNAVHTAEAKADIYHDPLLYLAEAAGFDDGERWWEYMVEHRLDSTGIAEAVHEAMQALREELPEREDRPDKYREAYMRKMIRQAEKDGYTSIAVICGAWHAPVLVNMPKQKDDNDLLKGLAKVKVETTWIPWTYNRLTFASGYGAGIQSPGWYDHVWHYPHDDGTMWMAKVARLFREKQMDTSTAHIIEAVRLAGALAALRGLSKAGLEELNEATLAVLCNGDSILLQLLREQLIVSDTIGQVPHEVPKPPLLQDVERLQKRLRLPAEAGIKELTLDLREATALERSIFLHRLLLIDIAWAHKTQVRSKGTFKEQWQLKWEPEFSIRIIEKGNWGNTLEEAAASYIAHQTKEASSLRVVCDLLEKVIPADLPQAVEVLIAQINNLAAATNDVVQLLEALPALVSVSRYGNVRQTDEALVLGIVNSMIARVCVSLPAACVGIDDDSAATMTEHIYKLHESITLLNQETQRAEWYTTLGIICDHQHTSPVVGGYSTRVLADAKVLEGDILINRFHAALSRSGNIAEAASWLEGFLKGSGTILIIDERLWSLVDQWVYQLNEADFIAMLPILRRTFSQFTHAERRKIGEKAKKGDGSIALPLQDATTETIDHERGRKALSVVAQLLGIERR